MSAAKPFALFTGFTKGVNNIDDPARLTLEELSTGVDIDIDDVGRPSRKKGFTLLRAGKYRWGWSDGVTCLAWRDGNFVSVAPDFSSDTVLLSGLTDHRIVYVKAKDKIYFTNNHIFGYVQNGAVFIPPSPTEPFKETMPPGNMIEYYQNRIWIIRGDAAWPSDALELNQRDTRMAPKSFPGRISLFKAVKDGIFIAHKFDAPGITGKIYFAEITDPTELVPGGLKPLAFYNATPHCLASVDGALIQADKTIKGNIFFFATEKGLCLGVDGGEFANYTIQRYAMPEGNQGSAFYRINHKGTAQMVMSIIQ